MTRTAEQIKQEISDHQRSIKALEKELRTIAHAEQKSARDAILALMAQHGLTVEALVVSRRPHDPPAVHYRGPNGELWMGRGPRPEWIKGKDKSQFEQPGPMPKAA